MAALSPHSAGSQPTQEQMDRLVAGLMQRLAWAPRNGLGYVWLGRAIDSHEALLRAVTLYSDPVEGHA